MERIELTAPVAVTPCGTPARVIDRTVISICLRTATRARQLEILEHVRGVLGLLVGLEFDAELLLGILLGTDQHKFGPFVIEKVRRIDG